MDAEKAKPLPGQQIADHAVAQLKQFADQGIGLSINEGDVDMNADGGLDTDSQENTSPFFLAVVIIIYSVSICCILLTAPVKIAFNSVLVISGLPQTSFAARRP